MSGKLIVVAGAQFGSEGKGAVADHLSRQANAGDDVVVVRVAGPNAGHTVYGQCPPGCDPDHEHLFHGEWIGHPWKLRSVPVAAVSNPNATLVIAAGSEIDPAVLNTEIHELDSAGYKVSGRLLIDGQATMLLDRHIETEKNSDLVKRLGSTAKGIGAARADRIWRSADLAKDYYAGTVDTAQAMKSRLAGGATAIIEGTQGYGLGLHAGNYPQCTSSDCRAVDFLAMAGLSPWGPEVRTFEVWLAARVRPIRVAGNSGPLKDETSWSELGLPEERTTVTKKVRRVGGWDADLVRSAVQANGGFPVVRVALTMADTIFPELAGRDGQWLDQDYDKVKEVAVRLEEIEDEVGAPVQFVGTSPVHGLFIPNDDYGN